MTLSEVIEYVDELKPNAFTLQHKTRLLSELEGRIETEVFLKDQSSVTVYCYSDDKNTELQVKAPYDNIYALYLMAMIDFFNGEYNRYANTYEMFNSQYIAFVRWYCAKFRPADRKNRF